MDWARSCYASNWRLTSDPSVLTPGYYWFNNDGPFLPFPSAYGSRNWTTDDFQDPPVGEASGAHRYYRGTPPAIPPPAVLVGTAADLGGGIALGSGSSLPFPSGVNARCYLTPPDPASALWLQGEDFTSYGEGDLVPLWRDSSLYARDVSNNDPATMPTVSQVTLSGTRVGFAYGRHLDFSGPFVLDGDLTVLAAIIVPGGLFGGTAVFLPPLVGSAIGPLVVSTGLIGMAWARGNVSFAASALQPAQRHIVAARRVQGQWTFRVDGTTVGVTTAPPLVTFSASVIASTQRHTPATGGFEIQEILAYDQSLSDSGFNAQESRLIASWLP